MNVGVKSQLRNHNQSKNLKLDAWAPFVSAHATIRENSDAELARGRHDHLTESLQVKSRASHDYSLRQDQSRAMNDSVLSSVVQSP